jgi:hypothetical protein
MRIELIISELVGALLGDEFTVEIVCSHTDVAQPEVPRRGDLARASEVEDERVRGHDNDLLDERATAREESECSPSRRREEEQALGRPLVLLVGYEDRMSSRPISSSTSAEVSGVWLD